MLCSKLSSEVLARDVVLSQEQNPSFRVQSTVRILNVNDNGNLPRYIRYNDCLRQILVYGLVSYPPEVYIIYGASEWSQNDGRKMYEMLAKGAGKVKDIYTNVDCGFPHPRPFYGVNAELISFSQGDLLAHSFKQAKSFLKKLLTGQVGK